MKSEPANQAGLSLKTARLFLLVLLVLAAAPRLLGWGKPYLGNFCSYQTISASMARFFVREGFSDLLSPKLDILVNGAPGLHLHYYPVASLLAAVGSFLLGGPFEIWGRLQAVFFSLATVAVIYGIGRRVRGDAFGLIAAAVYAFSPISVIYGQSFMNEAGGVFLLVLALYAFLRAREAAAPGLGWTALGVLSAGMALVTRLNGFYLFLPLFALWCFGPQGWDIKRVRSWFVLCVLIGLLPLAWYGYTYWTALENPHVFNCMFPQLGRQVSAAGWSLKFFSVTARTIATLDFTPLGLVLLLTGFFLSERKFLWIAVWFFGVLTSFFLMPQKIIDHNFYTLHLVPPASFFIALTVESLEDRFLKTLKPGLHDVVWIILLSALLMCSVRYFYNPVARSVLPENKEVLQAAEAVRRLVPAGEKIIAARGSANCLLYYSDRRGWSFDVLPSREVPYSLVFQSRHMPQEQIQEISEAFVDPVQWLEFLRRKGAGYFAAAGPLELEKNRALKEYLRSRYKLISDPGDPFQIFDMK